MTTRRPSPSSRPSAPTRADPEAQLAGHLSIARARVTGISRTTAALSPYSGKVAVLGHGIACGGAVDGPLGRLNTLHRDWPAADAHLTSAIELNRSIGASPALARTQTAYAELLLRRDQPRDRTAATRMLDEAGAIAASLGMTGLQPTLHRVKALLTAAGPQANRKRTVRSSTQRSP